MNPFRQFLLTRQDWETSMVFIYDRFPLLPKTCLMIRESRKCCNYCCHGNSGMAIAVGICMLMSGIAAMELIACIDEGADLLFLCGHMLW